MKKQIITPASDIKSKPELMSELESQCLFGEIIDILKFDKNWAYIKSEKDNYKGWIKTNTIGEKIKSTHKIRNVISNVYIQPDIKSPLLTSLYLNSRVYLEQVNSNWYKVLLKNKVGFISKENIYKKDNYSIDWSKTALMFLNSPYLWGGKTYYGIDCSGLVQIALESVGLLFPRNTSNQIRFKSKNVFDYEKIEKECLVFWDGHVGIMLDENNILHSNAHHLCVKIENLNNASKRIGEIKAIKKVNLR